MESTRNIRKLNELNKNFYAQVAQSFSDTREYPWNGWYRAGLLYEGLSFIPDPKILDLGCGNGRLKRFLDDNFPDLHYSYVGVDSCPALAEAGGLTDDEFVELDIVDAIITGGLKKVMPTEHYDLVCAFGLMHHIPTVRTRLHLVGSMVRTLKPQRFGIVSFWQFMKDERLAKKAEDCTVEGLAEGVIDEGMLEQRDYLLGWQNTPGVYRYCHSFVDDEVDALFAPFSSESTLHGGFRADGRTDNLNLYAIFQRH